VSATPSESDVAGRPVPGGAAFRRVLLKLSGEALMGDQSYGMSPEKVESLAA